MAQNTSPIFGGEAGGGFTVLPNGGFNSFGNDVFLMPDGRILVAGSRFNGANLSSAGGPDQPARDFLLERFMPDGSVDTSFGTGGRVTTAFGLSALQRAATLQSDGKIIVVGAAWKGPFNNFQFAVARYNTDGSLDTTFDVDGKLTTVLNTRNDQIQSVVALPTGKILVGGFSTTTAFGAGSFRDFAMARYNADGSLDTTFNGDGNSDGIIVTPVSATSADVATSIRVLSTGKILLMGNVGDASGTLFNAGLVRYNADGSLDTGFGTGGKFVLSTSVGDSSTSDFWHQVIEDSNGKLLLIGQVASGLHDGSTRVELIRLNADGSPDATFNGDGNADGRIVTHVGDILDVVYRLVELPNGKYVVSGLSFYNQNENYGLLLRYNHDGSLDTSFGGGDGIVLSPWAVPADAGYQDIAIQADGKIVVTGFRGALVNGSYELAVVRYNTDGTLDTSFGSVPRDSIVQYTLGAAGSVLIPNAHVHDAELAALNSGLGDYGGATLTLVRHGGANSADHYCVTGALSMTATSATAGSLALDGTAIGTYTDAGSGLQITLAAGTTQARLDKMLPLLTYSNSSATSVGTVQIDLLFNDGNAGAQGTGGASSVTAYAFVVTVDPVEIKTEGMLVNEGTAQMEVHLDHASSGLVTVRWSTLDGSAHAGSDYVAVRDELITFQPGETSKMITLQVINDTQAENTEFFLVNFSDPVGATLADEKAQVPVVIVQNDAPPVAAPTITVANIVVGEQDRDDSFIVMLSAPSTQSVSVNYATVNGSAGAGDFVGTSGTLVFAPGEMFRQVEVSILNDGIAEGTETFSLSLTGAVNAVIGTPVATGTILDDDSGPVPSVSVTGTSGADFLFGGDGIDTLTGGAGNDLLVGDMGPDVLVGGAGDDIYVVQTPGTVINENPGEGIDTVFVRRDVTSFTLPANVENLYMGRGALNATGNALNNYLSGNPDPNLLSGMDGDDTLVGNGCDDTLDGGAGTDTTVFPGNFSLYDIVVETATGDLLVTGPTGTARLHAVEFLQFDDRLFGVEEGTAASETLVGGTEDDLISAGDGNDTVEGGGGDDALYGDAGQDSLVGGTGSDLLNGGTGADTMVGGTGDDTYFVDNVGDVVVEDDGPLASPKDPLTVNPGGGTDTVHATINYNLTSAVENLVSAAGAGNIGGVGNALPNNFLGNEGNNSYEGKGGNDTIDGAGGVDTAVYGGARSLYTITTGADPVTVSSTAEGTDTLRNVERLQFADGTFAIGAAAAAAAQVVSAIFGAAAVADLALMGQYLSLFDNGLTIEEGVTAALASDRFLQGATSHTDAAFVNFVYHNLVGSAPAPALLDTLTGLISSGVFTQASMGAYAAGLISAPGAPVPYTSQTVSVLTGRDNANDALTGTAGQDVMVGRGGNDVLTPLGGNDVVVGGAGIDRAVFANAKSAYAVTHTDLGLVVTGAGETDVLIGVERATYSNVSVAYDIGGNAGIVAKVIGAIFGAAALADKALVGQYLAIADAGATYEQVLGAAAASDRFAAEAGGHSNAQFVDRVYFNLVSAHPSPAVVAQFVAILEQPGYSQAYLGTQAADTTYNLANVGLAGLALTGLEYTVA